MLGKQRRKKIIFYLFANYIATSSTEKKLKEEFESMDQIAKNYISTILLKKAEIEKNLVKFLGIKWTKASDLDKAILLLATFEIRFTTLDKKIVINEAIEFHKKYGQDDFYKIANAFLDRISNL